MAVLTLSPAAAATPVENKALVLEVFQALESGDVAVPNRAFAPDAANHFGARREPRNGPHKTFAEAAPFAAALADRKVTVLDSLAEGELVTVRSRLCGRHTGIALFGVEPSGRAICADYINLYRVRNGRIVDNHVFSDSRALERQVKGEPEPAVRR